jgi:hypothetical protein
MFNNIEILRWRNPPSLHQFPHWEVRIEGATTPNGVVSRLCTRQPVDILQVQPVKRVFIAESFG